MRTTISQLALALALALGLAGGTPARAEDKVLRAAEQAYKDAWWAETGGGNLNEALALYEKVATEEGPAAIKAKALYRRASAGRARGPCRLSFSASVKRSGRGG